MRHDFSTYVCMFFGYVGIRYAKDVPCQPSVVDVRAKNVRPTQELRRISVGQTAVSA